MSIKKLYLIPILGIFIFLIKMFFTTSRDSFLTLIPIFILVTSYIFFISKIYLQDGGFKIDVGFFAISYTFLYSIIPLLSFYFTGNQFCCLADARLTLLAPNASKIYEIYTYYITYFISLGTSYICFRKPRKNLVLEPIQNPSRRIFNISFLILAAINIYFLFLKLVFSIGFDDFYDSENITNQGSLLLQQINAYLDGYSGVFLVIVIAFLVFYKNNKQYRFILFLFLSYQLIINFLNPGSRGFIISCFLYIAFFWHTFHPIKTKKLLFIFSSVIFLFIFLGFYRTYDQQGGGIFSDLIQFQTYTDVSILQILTSATNEFQTLFATTYDVFERVRFNNIPWQIYINDFINFLPPQQILPFEKLDGPQFYLRQINSEDLRVGYMWGVISQGLIGLGRIELLVRGLLMGFIFSKINLIYFRNHKNFFFSVFYIILCLGSIWTMRSTSGTLFFIIWSQFVPVLIILSCMGFPIGLKLKK